MRIVIAGGSGFLGRQLVDRWSALGHEVVVLTRSVDPRWDARQVHWDARTQGAWSVEVDRPGGLAVVNLAGKLVDCRPTAANIAALRDSRVDATRALVEAARRRTEPVDRWLQSSTTAIWSDAGEQRLIEDSPVPSPGLPQMTGVADAWEQAFDPTVTRHHTVLRTSIVLAPGCPAWERLRSIVSSGAGGRVGSGRQWFSWIHLDDWLRIADGVLGLPGSVSVPAGVLVAASPQPVRNAELMQVLRHALRRPGIPTPALLARVGAIALRTDPALALTGRHATSAVLHDLDFTFEQPELAGAVQAVRDAR